MSGSSERFAHEREKGRNFKRKRPAQIEPPGPGQESVWDYPRPPRVEPVTRRIRIGFGGVVLADSVRAYRVIETASPPVYYLPPDDVRTQYLEPSPRSTFCEWKGRAKYWSVRVGDRFEEDAAWSYPDPNAGYETIRNYLPSTLERWMLAMLESIERGPSLESTMADGSRRMWWGLSRENLAQKHGNG